jgi:hypothetical protein
MKKILVTIVVILFCIAAKSQTPTQVINTPGSKYVFSGSLAMASDHSSNSQKIIIKIYGGSWFGDSNGETTYYISNRNGLSVRKVSLGGEAISGYLSLKAYQNGGNIDFYLVPEPNSYVSFAITSYSYGYTLTPGFVAITEQTSVPIGTDITASLPINPVFINDGAGNVGIGTSSPAEKLSVNGKIRAHEIKVELSGWSDFVFAKDYVLPTLQETEKHIKEKGHLSGIPPAAEVEKNGVDLGDMNKRLLQKIEELTLYLIEQDKKSKIQEAINREMKSKVSDLSSQIEVLKSRKK